MEGKVIRRALEDKGVTLAEVGRRCGVTRNHVSQIVAGQRQASRNVRSAIAAALGWDPWAEDEAASTDGQEPRKDARAASPARKRQAAG